MRVAVSTDGTQVSPHFGRCPVFTLFDVENGQVTGREVVENPGHVPGRIPEFLQGLGVRCVIAGGMGQRARDLFAQRAITTFVGVTGAVEDAVQEYAGGRLKDGDSLCSPGAGKGYGFDKIGCDHQED
jgi:predicted Fe-Mo cluster-binding NifX family protein